MVMAATAQLTAQSLFVVYKQLSEEAQQAFKELMEQEPAVSYVNADWLPYTNDTLKEIWDNPEEDFWDELYAKQHPAR